MRGCGARCCIPYEEKRLGITLMVMVRHPEEGELTAVRRVSAATPTARLATPIRVRPGVRATLSSASAVIERGWWARRTPSTAGRTELTGRPAADTGWCHDRLITWPTTARS